MTFPFTFSRDSLTVFIEGVPETVDCTHLKWDEIYEIVTGKVTSDIATLKGLIDTRAVIAAAVSSASTFGRVTVGYDAVLLDGKPIHSHLTARMLDLIGAGLDIAPWARFMDKLYSNPSRTAVNELFLWLEQSGMPITENGNFLAYKKVRDDYTSYHQNADGSKFANNLGRIVSMPRNEVDDRRENTCSQGLHFCSWSYLPSYYGSEGRVMVVEIDPADVVSIPSDYNNAKGRAWRYLIRGEVDRNKVQFAFEGKFLVANSEYHSEWDEEEDEEEEQEQERDEFEFNAQTGLYLDQKGNVDDEDLGSIDSSWTPLTWPPVVDEDGHFHVVLTNDEEVNIAAVYDEDMELISAQVDMSTL